MIDASESVLRRNQGFGINNPSTTISGGGYYDEEDDRNFLHHQYSK